jgi:hypothetical protein
VPLERTAIAESFASGLPALTDAFVLVEDRELPPPARPSSAVFAPVLREGVGVAGFSRVVFSWDDALANSLPASSGTSIDGVLTSTTSATTLYAFSIKGAAVTNTGASDGSASRPADLAAYALTFPITAGSAAQAFTLTLYPTAVMRDSNLTDTPVHACVLVVCIITVMSLLFWLYDWWASGRSAALRGAFVVTQRMVEDVYPEGVRSRMLQRVTASLDAEGSMHDGSQGRLSGELLCTRFADEGARALMLEEAPIADLFPAVTVLFADCCGFTAWAANVTPARVLTVLEAIFNAFDQLASKEGVFKLETSTTAAALLRACLIA